MANRALKKCPICNSISQNSDSSCGVCGEDLSGIVSRDLVSLEAEREPAFQPKKQGGTIALVLLVTGLAVIGVGTYLFFASGVIGLFLLLAGVTITASILGVSGSTFGTPGGGKGSHKSRGGKGKYYTVRREREEMIAWENRKKGEED